MKILHTSRVGDMWEGYGWEIQADVECSEYGGGVPCPHCHSDRVVHTSGSAHRNETNERKWVCPRVVVAYNEAPFNSTGVCLDCLLEAVATLKNKGVGA
jgi:transposase-like protein